MNSKVGDLLKDDYNLEQKKATLFEITVANFDV